MTISITKKQQIEITNVVGKCNLRTFPKLWNDLDKNRNSNNKCSAVGIQTFSKTYNGVDAKFNFYGMELIIDTIPFNALNDLLEFAGYDKINYNSLSYNQSGLNITIK